MDPIEPRYYSKDFKFKNIKVVGHTRPQMSQKWHNTAENIHIDEDAMKILDYTPTHSFVRQTKDNFKIAVNKFDAPKILPDNETFWQSYNLLLKHLEQSIPRHKPTYKGLYMDFKTSSGYPLNRFWKDKEKVPEELLSELIQTEEDIYIWQLAMKKERLPITKIRDGKMRSYMMPPLPYLIRQKKFSQAFNNYLKSTRWSAYGFNYHKRGFHMKMNKLRQYWRKFEYDVTNWDKRFSLKSICCQIRKHFLDMTKEEEEEFDFINQFEIEPTVLLPTGEVIKLKIGQCSGSENTTSDNILAHMLMVFYEIVKGVKENYGYVPTLDEIYKNCEFNIYSDDIIGACSEFYSFLINPQKKKNHYEEFGMTIEIDNPEKFKTSNTLEGLKFLGLIAKDYYGIVVPDFDYEIIKNSSVVVMPDETHKTQLTRFIQMLDLLTFNENYEAYRQFIFQYADFTGQEKPYLPTQPNKISEELCLEVGGGRN